MEVWLLELIELVMFLAKSKKYKRSNFFPYNQNAEDLLMEAPSEISEKQLKELNIKTVKKVNFYF